MEFFPSVQFQEEYLCFVAAVFCCFFPRDYITNEHPAQCKRFSSMRGGSICLKMPCKSRRKKQH